MVLLCTGIEPPGAARNAARRRWDEIMQARTRKGLGCLVLLAYLAIYALAAGSLGVALAGAPVWLQIVYYAIAGFAWVFPLKPLFTWMNKPDLQ
jgi:Protein of unknown function (DUF2842)